eukprot:TRINITY_DN20946_c0_g1_i1.p1 TRINITY_DN20946_c0_g1~~TRINITY_DN20946_c0_g1_i1.p1  ORF type:complete len:390 (+),score=99.18 TRINITY_DN20946_c0_g1_i1:101-1270(+)
MTARVGGWRGGSMSERHAAMARMRERRGGGHDTGDEKPWAPSYDKLGSTMPSAMRPKSGGFGAGFADDLNLDDMPPPPRCPAPPGPRGAMGLDMEAGGGGPPVPRCPAPPGGPPASRGGGGAGADAGGGRPFSRGRDVGRQAGGLGATTPREARREGGGGNKFDLGATCPDFPRGGGGGGGFGGSTPRMVEEEPRSGRVRGPAEARAARKQPAGDSAGAGGNDPIPPGAAGADFKTLQQMIAKGIQEAEVVANTMENGLGSVDDGAEMRRHKEEMRRRREEEAGARQRERDAAREKRRREAEERQRRMAEELEKEEKHEQRARQEEQRMEAQKKAETVAAARIQARIRGRQSRQGLPVSSLVNYSKEGRRKAQASKAARSTAAEADLLC